MFYSTQFVFIHIPRTGGTSLETAWGQFEWVSKDVDQLKHAEASALKRRLLDWDRLWKFTILRDPWEICQSWYRNVLKSNAEMTPESVTPYWREYVTRVAALSWDEFLRQEVLGGQLVPPGGFSTRYLDCDRDQIQVFHSVYAADWALCNRTGECPALPRLNSTAHGGQPLDDRLRPEVLAYCHEDVDIIAHLPREIHQRPNWRMAC